MASIFPRSSKFICRLCVQNVVYSKRGCQPIARRYGLSCSWISKRLTYLIGSNVAKNPVFLDSRCISSLENGNNEGNGNGSGGGPEKGKVLTIPNALSVFRIVASPYIGYLILHGCHSSAFIWFLVCSLTDVADGYIARRFPSQRSVLGSVIDPLGDKLMVGIMSVCATYTGLFPWPLLSVILLKDFGLVTASLVVRYHTLEAPKTLRRFLDVKQLNVEVKPNAFGKYTTFLQVVAVASSVAFPFSDHAILQGLWWVTGVATVATMFSYARGTGFRQIK